MGNKNNKEKMKKWKNEQIREEKVSINHNQIYFSENEGYKFGAGGALCAYCPNCYGNRNWCPSMD